MRGKTIARRDSLRGLDKDMLGKLILLSTEDISVPIIKGDIKNLPPDVTRFIAKYVRLCKPKGVYLCDGSQEEADEITDKMVDRGMLMKLPAMDNCYLARTDPGDVARVESRTFLVTPQRRVSVATPAAGPVSRLGQWMSPQQMEHELDGRMPGCMRGRVMYVIPFSMGPVGGPLSCVGVQLTDSNYVVLSMRIMTRVTSKIWQLLQPSTSTTPDFVQCVHSIGAPRPMQRKLINHWPCDPERVIISHFPDQRRIVSYGSGYGGNSLLGKKCFALRIASSIARDEGWLAEHMLIMSVISPQGQEKFVAAAFPSACGKTNLAMMTPAVAGWKVRCVGDDIAWMRFDKQGRMRAINPEAGFFGVAPGTNHRTNPAAMATLQSNTVFTNVGVTEDGTVFWEGLEEEVGQDTKVTTWLGQQWRVGQPGGPAAHPNSRFCCPASQCPNIHPKWEDPEGVPIDAIVFGGRRPEGVPLVYEALNWEHGVLMGAALKSEATAAAEHKGKQIMHDPMAMRPFMGYNFGHYLQHWLSMKQEGRHMPSIFHVNWFRRDSQGHFLWPGFGENIRVLEWMCRRMDGDDVGEESAVGVIPRAGCLNLHGLSEPVDWQQLFSLPRDFWLQEAEETEDWLHQQLGDDMPHGIRQQVAQLQQHINQLHVSQ